MKTNEIKGIFLPILDELIESAKVEGNALYTLRITPTETNSLIYVASIDVATKVQTGREKVVSLGQKHYIKLRTICEELLDPVGVTSESSTFSCFFFLK